MQANSECRYFVREYELNDGQILKINQNEIGDVGCVVWDAAIVLSKYIESQSFKNILTLDGSNILEIGAGTGLCGIVSSCLGAQTTITDLPQFQNLINKNINENKHLIKGKAKFQVLEWGKDLELFKKDEFQCILMSDCIYYDESLEPLLTTLNQLCSRDTKIFCSFERRDTEHKKRLEKEFFKALGKDFKFYTIPISEQDKVYSCDDIVILVVEKKQ
ncbi:DgyrCDS7964 [Dimorphilus gyrociliatus]|uniref:DgyrCDS7964 n=1 Tax=Dimorphilus gyrociliatus TaxID=2664684 RepID=A0A7I8VUF1_9ANNE|nr:DgyrCDS7964 [Dimorphilus gyrociliatus]